MYIAHASDSNHATIRGRLTRRRLLRGAALALSWAGAALLGACGQKIVEVQRIIEVEKEVTKEITRVVDRVVRETVIVASTPQVIEKMVEKVVTAQPPAKPRASVVAHATAYGWTVFARQMAPAFEEAYPHITIEWRSVSDWRAYPRQIAEFYAADQLGDLIEGPFGSLPAVWMQAGIIRSLDEIMAADAFDASGLFRAALRACRYQGQQIGLPFVADAGDNVLLYNQDLFQKAEAQPPSADWTLDALARAGAALTRSASAEQAAVFGLGLDFALPSAYPLLHTFDAELISEDGRQTAINNDAGVAFLRWAYEWLHQRRAAPRPAQALAGLDAMFRGGQIAMWRGSLRQLAGMQQAAAATPPIGAALFPQHPATGRVGAAASGMAFCLSRRSQAPLNTFQWVKFITSQEMGVRMFLEGYAEPGCRVAAWNDPRILERYPICAALAEAADNAQVIPLPWNLRHAECLDAWNWAIRPLLTNETTPQDCAAQIARKVQQILEEAALRGEAGESLAPSVPSR